MAIYNKISSKRSSVYNDIVGLIKANGWTDVASKPATEYNVFYSPGSSGTNELYFQMIPFTSTASYALQTVLAYTSIQVNFKGVYTPGAPGVAGTFERTTTGIVGLCRTNCPLEQPLSIWYDITADHISIVVEEENPSNKTGYWLYVGLPSRALIGETSKSGMIFMCSSSPTLDGVVQTNFTPLNGNPTATTVYTPSMPLSRTLKGKLILSEIAYGDTTLGLRGVIDDIYSLTEKTLIEGDTITLGDGRVFRYMTTGSAVYWTGSTSSTITTGSLPTYYFAFRVA